MEHDNCQHLLDDLSDFLDGEASAEVCAEIERHLAGCENCRVMVDTLRKTIVLYHELPQPEVPEDARRRLYQALDLNDFLTH
ncbi:MAG: zf-HC2 domain-containing protein [Ardenticatenaceae bacterium]|nr:zf-HC2 domain-containing protein [Ardenticatenaceae bacterium]